MRPNRASLTEQEWLGYKRLRRTMYDMLREHGFDLVEVEYEGHRDSCAVESMTFHRGAEKLACEMVPKEVSDAVNDYVHENIPGYDALTLECDGSARIYPTSEYACFEHFDSLHSRDWEGDPGVEVPEEDVCPSEYDDDFLLCSSGEDDEDDENEGDEDEEDE